MIPAFGYPTNAVALTGPNDATFAPISDDIFTFALVPVNNITGAVITAYNRALPSRSYTFTSTLDSYEKIFSGQCERVGAFINNKLEQLSRSNEDENEAIVDSIADVIDLVGEPAFGTALMEARVLKDDWFLLEHLLLGIASAHHKETEPYRIQLLRYYANSHDYRLKRAAIRALGRMKSELAKSVLRQISTEDADREAKNLAAALLR
jgi:hypothetical protein